MLSSAQRNNLLQSSEEVYKAFAALSVVNSLKVGDKSLAQYVSNKPETVDINGRQYQLTYHDYGNGKIGVRLTAQNVLYVTPPMREVHELSEAHKMALLINPAYEYFLEIDKAKNPILCLEIKRKSQKMKMGGRGKIDLYPEHLGTLFKIHEHLKSDQPSNMLIALATGSGKTFIQALWLMVLKIGNVNGVFALPNKLVDQFKNDFRRLVDDELVDEILILKQNEDDRNLDAISALSNMQRAPQEDAKFVVASYEELLDRHSAKLENLTGDQVVLSFDEQHLVMQQEARKVKLKELAKKNLSMFLSATPDKETYRMCGDKPLAYMSSKQKADAGHGAFPKIKKSKAKGIDDKAEFVTKSMFERVITTVVDAIQSNQSSAIQALFEELQYTDTMSYYDDSKLSAVRDDLHKLRWSYQPPTSRKILAIIDSNEELVNLNNFINGTNELGDFSSPGKLKASPIYKNGNIVDREKIYKFLQQETSLDDEVATQFSAYKAKVFTERQAALKDKNPIASQLDAVTLAEQLDRNIFSGIVDYVLSELLDVSVIELNKLRRDDFNATFEKLNQILLTITHSDAINTFHRKLFFDEKTNTKGIDAGGAKELSEFIAGLILYYQAYPLIRKDFTSNWTLINAARDEIFDSALGYDFKEYAKKHRVLYVMKGMQNAEIPIENSKPFFGFDEKKIRVRNVDGTISGSAKRRSKSSFESLDPALEEYHYYPVYSSVVTETIADNYFKLGLVGMYVSNAKTEGFSDLNLHTVISVVGSNIDNNNDPAKSIQGLGRLRGKDETQKPIYLSTSSRKIVSHFDLSQLNADGDYYPEYFKAKQKYINRSVKYIGKEIGLNIKRKLYELKGEDDDVNMGILNDEVQLIILKAFRKIYNNNGHQVETAKNNLKLALTYTLKTLNAEIKQMKKPYQLPTLSKAAGTALYGARFVEHFFKSKSAKNKLKEIENDIKVKTDSHLEKLYIHIINRSNFHLLSEKKSTFSEITALFERNAKFIKHDIVKLAIDNMHEKDEFNSIINTSILPLLVKYINPAKQAYCLEIAKKCADWVSIYKFNNSLFDKFNKEENSDARSDIAIQIFKKVPELYYYLDTKNDKSKYDKSFITEITTKIQVEAMEAIKNGILSNLQKFLCNENSQANGFLSLIRSMLIPDDFQLVKRILLAKNNAMDFAKYIFNQSSQIASAKSIDIFVEFFSAEYPEVVNIQTLDRRAKEAGARLADLSSKHQATIESDPGKYFDDTFYHAAAGLIVEGEQIEINRIMQDELMPAIVLSFPVSEQNKLLAAIREIHNWTAICIKYSYHPALKAYTKSKRENEESQSRHHLQRLGIAILSELSKIPEEDLIAKVEDYECIARISANAIKTKLDAIENSTDTRHQKSALMVDYLNTDFMAIAKPLFIDPHQRILTDIFSIRDNAQRLVNEMKRAVVNDIKLFLKKDFINNIKIFFSEQNHKKIRAIFFNDKDILQFAEYLYGLNYDVVNNIPQAVVIAYFKSNYPSLSGLISNQDSVRFAQEEMKQIESDIIKHAVEDPAKAFNDKFPSMLVNCLQLSERKYLHKFGSDKLLLILVKSFDASAQQEIFKSLKGFNQWPELIFKTITCEEMRVLKDINGDEGDLNKVLASLSKRLLTDTGKLGHLPLDKKLRNYKQSCMDATARITRRFTDLGSAENKIKNIGAIFSGLYTSIINDDVKAEEQIGANLLSAYISNDFLNDVEPLFLEGDLIKLRSLFSDTTTADAFALFVVKRMSKITNDKPQTITPGSFMLLTRDFFNTYDHGKHANYITTLKTGPENIQLYIHEIKDRTANYQNQLILGSSLGNERKYFAMHPSDSMELGSTLNSEYTDRINNVVKPDLIEVFVALFQANKKSLIRQQCHDYQNWPALLLKYKNHLAQINDDMGKAEDTVLGLLCKIPGLDSLTTKDMLSLSGSANALKAGFEGIAKNAKSMLSSENIITFICKTFSDYQGITSFDVAPRIMERSASLLQAKLSSIAIEMSVASSVKPKMIKSNVNRRSVMAQSLNIESKAQISKLVNEQLIPVFLSLIDENKHEKVKAACLAYDDWQTLLIKYHDSFVDSQSKLMPDALKTILNEIPGLQGCITRVTNVDTQIQILTETYKSIGDIKPPYNHEVLNHLFNWLKTTCMDDIRHLLFEDDWNDLKSVMCTAGKAEELANKFLDAKVPSADVIKQYISTMVNEAKSDGDQKFAFIDQRIEEMSDVVKKFKDFLKLDVDHDKCQEIYKKHAYPIMKMEAFKITVLDTLQHLSKKDIERILMLFDELNVNSTSIENQIVKIGHNQRCVHYYNKIITLVDSLKNDNYDVMGGLFAFDFEGGSPDLNISNIPIVNIWKIIAAINNEQIQCHLHFNNTGRYIKQHDSKIVKDSAFTSRIENTQVGTKGLLEPAINIFQLQAVSTGMSLNSVINAATNRKIIETMELIQNHIVKPLRDTITNTTAPSKTKPASTSEALTRSAMRLGKEIKGIKSLSKESASHGTYVDAIDKLISPIIGGKKTANLSRWWKKISKSKSIFSNRDKQIKILDELVQNCAPGSNDSLKVIYEQARRYINNDYLLSDHKHAVRMLKRQTYALMVVNTANNMPNDTDFYKNQLKDITAELMRAIGDGREYGSDILKSHTFYSSTFNAIKDVIFSEDHDVNKLLKIQFLASDYNKDPLHNMVRKVSHFFDDQKAKEAVNVKIFCRRISTTSYIDAPANRVDPKY